ncbi:MAG: outer membrane lipoprotein-sorting protein [Pseudomonadales bacterium]
MRKTIVTIASILLLNTVAHAETAQEKGFAIAQEQDRRDDGWGDSTVNMKMILRRSNGQATERRLRLKLLEVPGDGDKGLTIFDEPKDVQGTTFLNYSHAVEPDDQWIYLPALRRTKRISSKKKTGRFMGSEFTYEDMSSFQLEKYDYKYLRDDKYEGQAIFVVESYPKDEFSGYSKQISFIDQQEYRPLKVEFYDRRGELLKTMEMKNYQQYLDKYWRAERALMQNRQTGKSTEMVWEGYQFKVGLSEADFNKSVLDRVR